MSEWENSFTNTRKLYIKTSMEEEKKFTSVKIVKAAHISLSAVKEFLETEPYA